MVLAMDRALVPSIGRGLRRDKFGDADQIVGDQVEQEIGSNGGDTAVLGLAHCTVLFAPAEDAFGHRPARLRHAIALVPRGASVEGALPALAGRSDGLVLRHMWRDVDGAQKRPPATCGWS